jgi:3-oxoadipate enol-lactonase
VIEVHHRETGPRDAPAVVLSNSLGATLAMWDRQAPELAERYRVVRYDLRGHGRSPVPAGPSTIADLGDDLLALLDRLDIERAALVGVSIGGMVSLHAAAVAPARVWSLVPCFTAAYLGPAETWRERAGLVRAEGTEAVADAVIARWFTPAFAAREPALVAATRAAIAATDRDGYASLCHAIETMDLRGSLAAISAPTLVIAGALDPSIPPEHGRLVADGIAGARFAVLEGAAHLGNIECADAFNGLLRDHLEATA